LCGNVADQKLGNLKSSAFLCQIFNMRRKSQYSAGCSVCLVSPLRRANFCSQQRSIFWVFCCYLPTFYQKGW